MKLVNSSRRELVDYTTGQLAVFFPDGRSSPIKGIIEQHIDEALARLQRCINAVQTWEQDHFNYLHSSQYCTYLYFLANTLWRNTQEIEVPTKLFLLNKLLNGIDMFYEIAMPDIFFIGHSTGIVLAKANYSNYLVLYQNSTVGKNHGVAPSLGEGVILYPNSAIIGRCNIAARRERGESGHARTLLGFLWKSFDCLQTPQAQYHRRLLSDLIFSNLSIFLRSPFELEILSRH